MNIQGMQNYQINFTTTQHNASGSTTNKRSTTVLFNPMGSNIQQRIMQKREQARNQAKHLVMKQFKNHEKFNESIDDIQKEIGQNKEDLKIYEEQLKWYREQKASLKEEFGITDDSKEQKDLLIIEKANNHMRLTDEEQKRFLELDSVTAYQACSLELDEGIKAYETFIKNTNSRIEALNNATKDLRIARLQDNGMFKAQDAADSIMAAADKEVIAMAIQDSLNIIEAKEKENAEAAEKVKEQLGTEEEQQIQTDPSTDLVEKFSNLVKELQQKLKALQQANGLSADDMKGLLVDQTV